MKSAAPTTNWTDRDPARGRQPLHRRWVQHEDRGQDRQRRIGLEHIMRQLGGYRLHDQPPACGPYQQETDRPVRRGARNPAPCPAARTGWKARNMPPITAGNSPASAPWLSCPPAILAAKSLPSDCWKNAPWLWMAIAISQGLTSRNVSTNPRAGLQGREPVPFPVPRHQPDHGGDADAGHNRELDQNAKAAAPPIPTSPAGWKVWAPHHRGPRGKA